MLTQARGIGVVTGLLALFVIVGHGQTQEGKPPAGNEVVLKGMVLNNVHTREKDKSVFIYALDGPPEVKVEVDRIMAEYPDKGLDGDAARKVQDQFTERLKYYIAGPQADELHKKVTYNDTVAMAVTGVIEERDGKKWITVSKYEPTSLQYPAKMLAPDKPFVTPDKEPLVLKINDTLTLKCLWVPPGKFLMGDPYYQCPHLQEDPPHMVTLTKGFYMAEHAVTEEMYKAVTGNNPAGISKDKDPTAPANVSCVNMYEFCGILSQKFGRKVRVPTAAEWEYAARVGTSNPMIMPGAADPKNRWAMPNKAKQPNAWGFCDMFIARSWERVSDAGGTDHQDMVDPQHIPPADRGLADKNRIHSHVGKGCSHDVWPLSIMETISNNAGSVTEKGYPRFVRFRVVVEAESTAPTPATQPSSTPAK
jgi:formylglycine-generating enzyme required for sulfatase activity